MFSAAIVVFRESLEAALILGIMAAATRGVATRGRWMIAGVITGLLGAALVASMMNVLANLASGMGQELFNSAILLTAVAMLAWHVIWMQTHAQEMALNAKNTAREISDGSREISVLFMVTALAVLREGAETVLFLYGMATSDSGGLQETLGGGLLGLAAGTALGMALYFGLLRIPLRWFFSVTSAFVLLLAASMASQAAYYLIQADVLPDLGAPIWDSSNLLSQTSPIGTLLHGLIGYNDQPAGLQIVFYGASLILILVGMRSVARRQANRQIAG